MSRKKVGRASWFKIFLHQKALIDSVSNENVGIALKAALQYFETGEIPQIDPLSFAIFSTFKQNIDESNDDFKKFSEAGQRGNKKRWYSQVSPPDTPLSPYDTRYREALSIKHYTEADSESKKAGKPPSRNKFSPPTVEEVRAYSEGRGYNIDPDRFVDYYTSIGWKVGKNPMKDWKAAVRSWSRKEQSCAKNEPKSLWTVGTTV